MRKTIGIVVVVIIALWLLIPVVIRSVNQGNEPSVQEAPYVVQTYSQYYFAKQVTGEPPNLKVTGYYSLQNGKWVYYKGSLKFNVNWPARAQKR